MEPVTILAIVGEIVLLAGKFRGLFRRSKLLEKDKDGFIPKVGNLLDELRFAKDVDMRIEYFAGEDLEGWLSQLKESRDMNVLEGTWSKIYEGFDRHIVQGIEKQLPRMKKLAGETSIIGRDIIPLGIRKEATNLAQTYPELIQLMEEFIGTIRKQAGEIKRRNFGNIVQSAITLDTQIKRIKIRANALLRDLCSVVIFVHDEVTRRTK